MVKYNECVENGISILIVAIFCSEGDNIFDSIQLTDAVNNYLHVVDEKGKYTVLLSLCKHLLYRNIKMETAEFLDAHSRCSFRHFVVSIKKTNCNKQHSNKISNKTKQKIYKRYQLQSNCSGKKQDSQDCASNTTNPQSHHSPPHSIIGILLLHDCRFLSL